MKAFCYLIAVLLIAGAATGQGLVNLTQWSTEDGGNDHWYGVVQSAYYWEQAYDHAKTLTVGGQSGYLATITSPAENDFILNNVTFGLDNTSIIDQYYLGGYDLNSEWHWITDEPFDYTNWNAGEPNNPGSETRVGVWGPNIDGSNQSSPDERIPGMWNDVAPTGYTFWSIVEFGGDFTPHKPGALPPVWSSLQEALYSLGYSVNTESDEIPGEVFFQMQSSNAAIMYQESSHAGIEAMGWYKSVEEGGWILGGVDTDLPQAAFLPQIDGIFGLKLHPNYTGTGYLEGIFYSEPALNDGLDRVKVFPTEIDGTVVPFSYLLCWEDWGDGDYQDMIVRLDWVVATNSSGQPVTEWNIAGTVTGDGSGLAGVRIDLYDGSESIEYTYTDASGNYLFEDYPADVYAVAVTPPMGWGTSEEVVEVILAGSDATVDFEMTEATMAAIQHVWWWKIYLEDLVNDGPRMDQFSVEDVNNWGDEIFAHFVDRFDGEAIRIEGVTYVSNPKRPLIFDDVVYAMLEQDDSYAASVRRNMLAIMLDIASNRLSQLKVISVDGATVSQALTYFADVYKENQYCEDMDQRSALVQAHLNLRRILLEDMVPAGIIPLSTPTILFKQEATDPAVEIPASIVLHQNYPNPFNPTTEISFSLPEDSDVRLTVFNVLGQLVTTLIDETMEAGNYSINWDASQAPSGVYLYRIQAGDHSESRKMLLLK